MERARARARERERASMQIVHLKMGSCGGITERRKVRFADVKGQE